MKTVNGEWGVFDEKAKKVVPDKIPLDKGVWSVRIVVWYGPTAEAGKDRRYINCRYYWEPLDNSIWDVV